MCLKERSCNTVFFFFLWHSCFFLATRPKLIGLQKSVFFFLPSAFFFIFWHYIFSSSPPLISTPSAASSCHGMRAVAYFIFIYFKNPSAAARCVHGIFPHSRVRYLLMYAPRTSRI